MKVSFDCWPAVLVLVIAVAELGLRLSTLQPRLRNCPWREWPRLLWRTMLDDRICLMGLLTAWCIGRPSDNDEERSP